MLLMGGNYKYFRFYLNREDEKEKEMLEYLDTLSGRDRSKFIKDCLLRDRIADDSENSECMNRIEKRLNELELKVKSIISDEPSSNKNDNRVDWHNIWVERKMQYESLQK